MIKKKLYLLLRTTVVMVTETKDRQIANHSNYKAIEKEIAAYISFEI